MKLVQGGLRKKEREREATGVASNCEKKVEMVVGEMMVKSDGREERGSREKEVLAAFLAWLGYQLMPHTSSPPRFLYHEIINEKLLLRRDHISQMTRPCDGNMDSVDWHKYWGRGKSVFSSFEFKVIAQDMRYVCVGRWGGGALKSIANIIPLSMSLAAHAFQTDLPKIQKFAKDCLSHQTAKYFSFYISIILFQTCVQTRNMN